MVKCSECGFLALRNPETRRLDMADPQYREKGQSDQFYPGGAIEALPVCFALKAKLFDEVKDNQANLPPFKVEQDATGGVTNEQDWMQREFAGIRAVIQKERTCPDGFTQWQPYFTPKEHREMMDRERMLQWQKDREESDRQWREHQSKLDFEWREKQESREQGRHQATIFWIAIVATVVLSAATIIGACIQRGGPPINNIIQVPTQSTSGTEVTPK